MYTWAIQKDLELILFINVYWKSGNLSKAGTYTLMCFIDCAVYIPILQPIYHSQLCYLTATVNCSVSSTHSNKVISIQCWLLDLIPVRTWLVRIVTDVWVSVCMMDLVRKTWEVTKHYFINLKIYAVKSSQTNLTISHNLVNKLINKIKIY